MAYTDNHTVTDTEWTMIADGVKNCGIQFNGQGDIRIHVGTAEPADLSAPGILLSSGTEAIPSTFGLGALPSDAQVWVRATGEYTSVKLTVLAY